MTKFEFLMMIASVVIAVGMTEIVGGWGRMVRTPAKVKFDWLLFGWGVVLLLGGVLYWLGMWPYAEVAMHYVGQVYFLVIPTLFFVLAAFAVTPDVPLVGSLDLRDYYWKTRKAIFLPFSALTATAFLADLVIMGGETFKTRYSSEFHLINMVGFGILMLLLLVLAFTRRLWVHAAVLGLAIIGTIQVFFDPVPVLR